MLLRFGIENVKLNGQNRIKDGCTIKGSMQANANVYAKKRKNEKENGSQRKKKKKTKQWCSRDAEMSNYGEFPEGTKERVEGDPRREDTRAPG